MSPVSVALEPDRVAERAVKGRSVFGRIGHNLNVVIARCIEALADRTNAAVHHVGRSNDVAAGFDLNERLADQNRDSLVVEDDAVAEQAVMAVAGIRIERHVAKNADVRHLFLDGADRLADEIFCIERFGAGFVAFARFGIGEERKARDGEFRRAHRRAHRFVDRETLDVGHRADGRPDLGALDQKQRPNQIVGREDVLAHHAPRPFGAAVTARAYRQIEAPGGLLRLDRGGAHSVRVGGRI